MPPRRLERKEMTDPKGTILEQLIEELRKFSDFSEFKTRLMEFQGRLGQVEHAVEMLQAHSVASGWRDATEQGWEQGGIRLSRRASSRRKRKRVKTRRK